jgi:hypothetical protein
MVLASQPNIGTQTSIKNIKSVIAGKGYQNRLYYKVENNRLIIIDLKDLLQNPKRDRYYQ